MTRTLQMCLVLLLISNYCFAQPRQGQARLDSLLAEVPKMKEDTNGVKLMSNIAFEYSRINPEEGLKWGEKGLALAQKTGWVKGEAIVYNNIGNNYTDKGVYPSALEAFFKALRIYEARDDKRGIAMVSGNIGNAYNRQKDHPKALEWHFKSLKIAEENGNKQEMGVTLGNIGTVYLDQGKNREAVEYTLKALHIYEEQNDKASIVLATGNIGNIYISLKQYPAALVYMFKCLRMAEEIGDKRSIAIALGNAGETYYEIAKDSAAPKPDSLVPASRTANLTKAADYLDRGIAASRELQFHEAIAAFSQYLSDVRVAQGDYKGAIAAYKQSVAVKDSLFNTANSEKIAGLETQRAVELKDKDIQIAKLKKRNERILFAGGFAVLLLIIAMFFRNYRKQQRSNLKLAKEKKRSEDLLLNILPAEVAEELKESGEAQAKHFEKATVLFTDFVNFTGTAEQLSPQALVKELHECFSGFDAIIERNGLEKIKTVGDAYIAVCGLPVADERHAQKCMQAALEIMQFMEERRKNEKVFEIRIGINSGPVVAGIVGVKKFAYDIWGDTVNTAARMEQHGAPGSINISESTYELVKNEFDCTRRGKIAAKHKGEVEMYFVAAGINKQLLQTI